jgi:uncharacterized protein YlzI (FlbEa/FlbD family)
MIVVDKINMEEIDSIELSPEQMLNLHKQYMRKVQEQTNEFYNSIHETKKMIFYANAMERMKPPVYDLANPAECAEKIFDVNRPVSADIINRVIMPDAQIYNIRDLAKKNYNPDIDE